MIKERKDGVPIHPSLPGRSWSIPVVPASPPMSTAFHAQKCTGKMTSPAVTLVLHHELGDPSVPAMRKQGAGWEDGNLDCKGWEHSLHCGRSQFKLCSSGTRRGPHSGSKRPNEEGAAPECCQEPSQGHQSDVSVTPVLRLSHPREGFKTLDPQTSVHSASLL